LYSIISSTFGWLSCCEILISFRIIWISLSENMFRYRIFRMFRRFRFLCTTSRISPMSDFPIGGVLIQ